MVRRDERHADGGGGAREAGRADAAADLAQPDRADPELPAQHALPGRAACADLHGGQCAVGDDDVVVAPQQLADRLRPYTEIGFRTVISEQPAPYDVETLERFIGEVLPLI